MLRYLGESLLAASILRNSFPKQCKKLALWKPTAALIEQPWMPRHAHCLGCSTQLRQTSLVWRVAMPLRRSDLGSAAPFTIVVDSQDFH